MRKISLAWPVVLWGAFVCTVALIRPEFAWIWIAVFFVVAIAMVGSVIHQDNKRLLELIPNVDVRWAFRQTLLQYLPLMALLIGAVVAQLYWQKTLTESLYSEGIIQRKPSPPDQPVDPTLPEFGLLRNARSVQDDAVFTVEDHFDKRKTEAVQSYDALNATVTSDINQRKDAVPNEFQRVMDRDVVNAGRCRWYVRFACHSLNDSYRSSVRHQTERMRADLHQKAANVETARKVTRETIIKQLESSIDQTKAATVTTINQLFWAASVLGYVTLMLLMLSVLKSLGYLFARLLLTKSGATQDFSSSTRRYLRGDFDLPEEKSDIDIDLGPGEIFYLATNLNFLGNIERKAIPSPCSLLFPRLLNRKYVLHKIVGQTPGASDFRVESDIGCQFVEVTLKDNEELILHLRYLAGYTSTVSFHRYLNFRLMGMVFGRLTYFSAAGPGTVLLLIPGGCSVSAPGQEFLQHRLVAWTSTSRFSVDSSSRLMDSYFSGISVKEAHGKNCILERATNPQRRNYLARFFRRFLWPL